MINLKCKGCGFETADSRLMFLYKGELACRDCIDMFWTIGGWGWATEPMKARMESSVINAIGRPRAS